MIAFEVCRNPNILIKLIGAVSDARADQLLVPSNKTH